MYLTTRNALGSNLNCLDLTDTYVEVGVARGDFASDVINQWKGKNAYLIDHWEPVLGVPDYCNNQTKEQHLNNLNCVRDRFSKDSRIQIIVEDSLTASKRFDDNSLDCVYLDNDHRYVHVLKELPLWWVKIKNNGLLTGHDYCNAFWGDAHNDPSSTWTCVKLAVDRFFEHRIDCSCVISSYEDSTPSFSVFKLEQNIDPKDILVLSCATDNLTYTQKTEANHRKYCDKHGYSYEMVRTDFWEDSHPAWSKLKFTHERLPHYKWIMWLDADAVFVNDNKKLEPFLIPRMGHVSSTWHAFNRIQLTNGISFWQNIPWTFDFLKEATSYRGQFSHSGVWEEEGIRRALDNDINNYGRWLGIEGSHFNSWPHYNGWLHGADLIHHWGGARFHKDKLIDESLEMAKHYEMSIPK